MEQEVKPLLPDTNTYIISLLFSSNLLNIEIFEEVDLVPRVGNLWLPIVVISPSNQVRFFFPRIHNLFDVGDKVVRIEHSKVETKALVWRLGINVNGGWSWNLKHEKKV
jgi:hypothetical protein